MGVACMAALFDSSAQTNGNYITFTGNTDHISVPDTALWDLQGDFTISMKVNFASTTQWQMLLTHHDGVNTQGFELGYTGSVLRLSPEGFTVAIDQAWSPNAGPWYHLVLTRVANTMNVYIDGQLTGSVGFTGQIGADDCPLMIGNYYYPGYAFTGSMDDVSVWGIAADQTMVNALASPLTGNEAGLYGYWDMDRNGQGLVVQNMALSGPALDGVTVGTATTPYFDGLLTGIAAGGNTTSFITARPNPFAGTLQLNLGEGAGNEYVVTIFNNGGQLVLSETVSGSSIELNTASLSPGLYAVRVQSAPGRSAC